MLVNLEKTLRDLREEVALYKQRGDSFSTVRSSPTGLQGKYLLLTHSSPNAGAQGELGRAE